MYKDDKSQLVFSPSDLIRFMESPFASWMERLRLERPEAAQADEEGEELKLVAKTGDAHEADFLKSLHEEGKTVREVRGNHDEAFEATRKATADGGEIIYQGHLKLPPSPATRISWFVRTTRRLEGRSTRSGTPNWRARPSPTTLNVLYVAPYNMQVRRLRERLPEGAHIGSVDKFQGQEAPVVLLSICSSAGDFGARGIGFVLDRNRLNVAISRAQSLAIVVGDPNIALTPVGSVGDMERVNLFCRLLGYSSSC